MNEEELIAKQLEDSRIEKERLETESAKLKEEEDKKNEQTNTENKQTESTTEQSTTTDSSKETEILNKRIADLEKKLEDEKQSKEEETKTYLEKQNEILSKLKAQEDKIEANILESSGAEDTEYVKFLAEKLIDDETNFEQAIAKLNEDKPNLFVQNRKSVGQKPNGNGSGKLSYSEWESLPKNERIKQMNSGNVDLS